MICVEKMMWKLNILCFICIRLVQAEKAIICPIGEIPSDCAAACVTCEQPEPCPTFACSKGCNCPTGMLRDVNGKCIFPSQCPKNNGRCPVGEIQSDCAQPKICVTCKNPKPCPTLVCSKGCNCLPNFLRDFSGRCIPKQQCLNSNRRCQVFEEYKECGTACPVTCANRYNRPEACTAVCVSDCFCRPGLLRDVDGSCVFPFLCKHPGRLQGKGSDQ